MTLLGIGEFARATGLSVPTLRAWADAGVLVPAQVDADSGPAAVLVVEGVDARYPRLLEAYDAVSAWALDRGHELGDPPYEVYLDDDRVEVRWPLRV